MSARKPKLRYRREARTIVDNLTDAPILTLVREVDPNGGCSISPVMADALSQVMLDAMNAPGFNLAAILKAWERR